jgi:hypothetical protein
MSMQSAGTLSPWLISITSPTTRSLTGMDYTLPNAPRYTVTSWLLISSLRLKNYFSLTKSAVAEMIAANKRPLYIVSDSMKAVCYELKKEKNK